MKNFLLKSKFELWYCRLGEVAHLILVDQLLSLAKEILINIMSLQYTRGSEMIQLAPRKKLHPQLIVDMVMFGV